jgi:prepilin-type processing-associated H-X9-DG protein
LPGYVPTDTRPSLLTVLGKFVEENSAMFDCPNDEKYFPQYGLSYEYNDSQLALKTREQVLQIQNGPLAGTPLKSSTVLISNDFNNFHGPEGVVGSRNMAFLDCHVE